MNKDVKNNRRGFTLERFSRRYNMPRGLFVLIILLYWLAIFFVKKTAHNAGVRVTMFGYSTNLGALTGVLSYFSNVCMIFLVVFYRKLGFIVSTIVLLIQIPPLMISMTQAGNIDNISGLFSSLFTILVTTIIYLNARRIEKYQMQMQEEAVTDTLTGIPNRFAISALMDMLIKKEEPFAVVSVDLNDFKNINDTMGHNVGNQVLKVIAERFKWIADNGASGTDDFLARLGGDEFAILVHAYKTDDDIVETIRAYREALTQKITVEDCDYFMDASFGYAEYPTDAENVDGMFSCADAAMHEVKRIGGAKPILRFTRALLDTEHAFEIERKIRTALDEDGVKCYLQPQFTIDHKLRGFEALARIFDTDGKMISPVAFIPVAEKTGLVDQVDNRVFRQAAEFAAGAIRKNPDVLVSVNVSVRHLMKNTFIDEIKETMERFNVPYRNLEIEITESIMIDSAGMALSNLNEAEKLGIKIAIDDFGTGYSSLSYLHELPAGLLKIDKSFVDVMNESESSKKYVAAIISIGHIMNMKVISEGVESEEQLETLRSVGCDYIQGYIWGKPMPLSDAGKLVD